jgi:hypothetical protein
MREAQVQAGRSDDADAFNDLVNPLRTADWEDLDGVTAVAEPALRFLAKRPSAVGALLAQVMRDDSLSRLSEHYDILDKIVLHEEPQFRVRLHVFLPGYFDRPHNHRWSYSSLILTGHYRHVVYGQDQGLTDMVDISSLKPAMIREEQPGSFYSLHHTMIHSVIAAPYTVSLVIRGPSMKNRFVVMDRVSKMAWWQYGAANEAPQDRKVKVMPRARFDFLWEKLTDLRIMEG